LPLAADRSPISGARELVHGRRVALLEDGRRVCARAEQHPDRASGHGAGCTALLGETCQPTPDGVCVDRRARKTTARPRPSASQRLDIDFAIEDPNNRGHYDSMATLRATSS
jgi:hypothetical protein